MAGAIIITYKIYKVNMPYAGLKGVIRASENTVYARK